MEDKVYINDVGTKIKLYTGQDISSATIVKISYKKPNGDTGEWDGSIEEDEYVVYIVQAGDLDQVGIWKLQAYVVLPDWTGRGETVDMEVFDSFG